MHKLNMIRKSGRSNGFSLIETMVALAILGSLVAIATPTYQTYVVRAKVAEGLTMMSGTKTHIATFQSANGRLPQNFGELGFGEAGGSAHGGDAGSFESVFGYDSDIWRQVEWQPKSGGHILVLRSKRKPQWDNVDIGLHLQVKVESDTVRFRCVVNNRPTRQAWVPANCRHGGVGDWGW
jgi:prepilin-type N-terminal cleavage/methylation domain-containing protein